MGEKVKLRKFPKEVTTKEENREYLQRIFGMIREMERVTAVPANERFNNTEIRLMNELIYAADMGERLISTQLADRLGITRSAVSQIVGKLEKEGAIRRVPDEVDRKIAYVELTDNILEENQDAIDDYLYFIGCIVSRMGVNKLEKFLKLADQFYDAMEEAAIDKENLKILKQKIK